ncbi:MAG: ATPase [Chitinophagales bacterium]|nr:ATPase [Chitinophagales bacterium]
MARKKIQLEYIIRSSPSILFEFVTQTSNLAQWFSDYCDAENDIFIFGWNGSFQRAKQLEWVEDDYVKYHWEDSPKDEFFSFRVYKSEISNETILEVIDFADAKEVKEQTFLWDKQIEDLKHAIGA